MGEVFALTISEGAISNMLARAREPLLVAAAAIRETVTASPVVCSDETSARVTGKTWWEWVFVGTRAVLHVIRPSRGKAVVQALFGTINQVATFATTPVFGEVALLAAAIVLIRLLPQGITGRFFRRGL